MVKNSKKEFVGEDSWFKRFYLIFDERKHLCHTIVFILTYNTEDTRSMVGHVVRNGNTVIIR